MKFYVLLFSLLAAFTSCGNSCDGIEYANEISDQSAKVNAAASAYSLDTTDSALCMDYVAELEAQIAVYEKYQECDEINTSGNIDEAINSAQASIDALDCN